MGALVSRPRSGTFVSRRSSFPSGPLQEEEGGTEQKKDRRVIFRTPSLQQLEEETMYLPNLLLVGLVCSLGVCEGKKDYYKSLGVEKKASNKEIKKAFRKLALKYHPDKNPDKDTSKKFQEIAEAYEILGDEDKRRQYDSMGHKAWDSAGSGGFKPGNFNFDDLFKGFDDDFFKEMNMFGSHFDGRMGFGKMGGGAKMHDINFEEMFNSPFMHSDDSDMFGRDMDMFGSSSSKVKTERRGGQRCKTVTQQVGNTRTTYTQCS